MALCVTYIWPTSDSVNTSTGDKTDLKHSHSHLYMIQHRIGIQVESSCRSAALAWSQNPEPKRKNTTLLLPYFKGRKRIKGLSEQHGKW